MAEAQISYKLDLILRLVDTTTGQMIGERQTAFYENDRIVTFLERDAGVYILLNRGRKDMRLRIEANGYLPAWTDVCYNELSEQFPEVEVAMIPKAKDRGFTDLITLEGRLPGLEEIGAAALRRPVASVAGYQEKRQILKLFSAKSMEEGSYALLHEGQSEYEVFHIAKKLDKYALRLKTPLTGTCRPEEPVARIVRGSVEPGGRYLLRVREDGAGTEYLVRYVVNGEALFKKIRFEEPEERRL